MTTIYDASFFANKPGLIPMCLPIVFADREIGGINWKNGPRYTDIDWTAFRRAVMATPPNSTVCLDIEGVAGQDEEEVTYAIVRALRTGRRLRPDCKWGFYAGPANFPAYLNGDADLLMRPELTEHDIKRRSVAQAVFQAIYPPSLTFPDSTLIGYRTGAVRACLRWGRKVSVIPVFTGTLHAAAKPTGEYLGDELVLAQLRVVRAFGTGCLWDGAAWDADGKYAGRADWNAVGKRYAWMVENEARRVST